MKYVLIIGAAVLLIVSALIVFGPRDQYVVAWQECTTPHRLSTGGTLDKSPEERMRCLDQVRQQYGKDSQ